MKTSFIEALASKSARRPWTTICVWLAGLAISGVLITTLLGSALVTQIDVTNNPESKQADTLIKERLATPKKTTVDETVIVRSNTLTVDDPRFEQAVQGLTTELIALGDGVVEGGVNYYMTRMEALVSPDRHSTLIPITMPLGAAKVVDQIYQVGDKLAEGGMFEIYYTGSASFDADTAKLAEDTLKKGETVGIITALIVLAVVFGAIAAAVLPILLGVIAVIAALGLVAVVGQAMDLSFFITNMVTMMGLAVGIDYSLFIVNRYREERWNGLAKLDAIALTGATANKAIFFSGMTVVLALISLIFFPLSIFKSMGIGAILVVITAIIASMTLLPAVMSLLGDRVNALRIPVIQRSNSGPSSVSGFWAGLIRIVTRRPAISLVITAGILIIALTPYFDRVTGMSGISGIPDDLRAKKGYLVLQRDFQMGTNDPAIVAIDSNSGPATTQTAVARLQQMIGSDKTFANSTVNAFPDKDLSIVYANLVGDPLSRQSMEAVSQLRSQYVPQSFETTPARVLVTGSTAMILDFNQTTNTYTPFILIFVLSLSFVILTIAFRSIVIPTTAIIMNLLSVGASYGLLVLVFQKGVGAKLFGFQQVDVIESWLPIMLFALLFGLSMDYQVFLLSRIRERFLQTRNNAEAVTFGLSSTGKLITGAALIMVAVFGGFALGKMVMFQQMGFGLAVAVFLDATLVRTILVPATMSVLGKYNWYLPKWLNWLPDVSLGETSQRNLRPVEATVSDQQSRA